MIYQRRRLEAGETTQKRAAVTPVPKFLIFRTEAKNTAATRRLCYVF
jgi:hypothetical protein